MIAATVFTTIAAAACLLMILGIDSLVRGTNEAERIGGTALAFLGGYTTIICGGISLALWT